MREWKLEGKRRALQRVNKGGLRPHAAPRRQPWLALKFNPFFAGCFDAGARVGAVAYNLAHSLMGALLVLGLGIFLQQPLAVTAGLIWLAHIGFDRALGYGLKYAAGFTFTHLGLIGRNRSST